MVVLLLGGAVALAVVSRAPIADRAFAALARERGVSYRFALSWTEGEGDGRETTSAYAKGRVAWDGSGGAAQDTAFRVFRMRRGEENVDVSGALRAVGGAAYVEFASETGTWTAYADGRRPWDEPGVPASFAYDALGFLPAALAAAPGAFVAERADVTELVRGRATRLVEGRFDVAAAHILVADLGRRVRGREPTDDERLADAARAEALAGLRAKLWVDAGDDLPRRFQAYGLVPDGQGGSASFDVIFEIIAYGDPVDPSVPDVVATRSASAGFAASAPALPAPAPRRMGDATDATETRGADRDGDGLGNALEAFYRTDADDPDTDGDGASDGEEVLRGRNPRGDGSLFGFGLGE